MEACERLLYHKCLIKLCITRKMGKSGFAWQFLQTHSPFELLQLYGACQHDLPFLYYSCNDFQIAQFEFLTPYDWQIFRDCSECGGLQRQPKKENDYQQETPRKLAEADSTVFDKIGFFCFADNGINVAPGQIRREGNFQTHGLHINFTLRQCHVNKKMR